MSYIQKSFTPTLEPKISFRSVKPILDERQTLRLLDEARFDSYRYAPILSIFYQSTNEKKVLAEFVLKEIIPRLPSKESMLDVGFGDGKLTRWIGRNFDSVVAIEARNGKEQQIFSLIPRGKRTTDIVRADFNDVNLGKGAFDFALASHVLYSYFPEDSWLKVAGKIADSLKPGGMMVFTFNGTGDGYQMVQDFGGRNPTVEKFANLLAREHGKRNVEVHSMKHKVIAGDLPHALHIAAFYLFDVIVKAKTTEVADYLSRFLKADGTYEMKQEQIAIAVRKR